MPYEKPTTLFVDFVHPAAGHFTVDQTWGLARPGAQIPGMELVWDYDQFPDDLSGRCLLLKLGLTCSIIEFSDEKAGVRFVITLEITGGGQSAQRETQIVRGDAWSSPGKGGSFSHIQFWGPLEPLRPGQLMILRARAATLSGTAVVAPGDLGTNEFRAEVLQVE